MKIIVIIGIIFLNIFAIALSAKMLKGYETPRIIGMIIVGEILTFFISLIAYALSASGNIPANVHSASKTVIILTTMPINLMLMIAPIMGLFNKREFQEIDQETFSKRLVMWAVIAIVVFIIEISYMKNIQVGILSFKNIKR